jgi:hypothetical protein
MQGGKNWILLKEMNKPALLGLSLAGNLVKPLTTYVALWDGMGGNLVKPLMYLYGNEWRVRGKENLYLFTLWSVAMD